MLVVQYYSALYWNRNSLNGSQKAFRMKGEMCDQNKSVFGLSQFNLQVLRLPRPLTAFVDKSFNNWSLSQGIHWSSWWDTSWLRRGHVEWRSRVVKMSPTLVSVLTTKKRLYIYPIRQQDRTGHWKWMLQHRDLNKKYLCLSNFLSKLFLFWQ